jgi:pyruvate-formate lyase
MAKPRPFAEARPQLERQYLDVQFDPASGLSKEELTAALARHQAEGPDEPRLLTRAWLFHLLCSQARLAVEPDDYFADKLEHHDLLVALREQWRREEDGREFAGDPLPTPGAWTGQLDVGHTCPDWRSLLAHGWTGLRDRAAARSGVFYEAVALVYEGAIILARRLAAALPADAPARPVLEALAERPPQTFHEALQLAYLHHELQEMENGYSVRSMGRFDLLYNDFLVRDLQEGRLTRDEAKELLKYFWVKFFARTQGKMFGKPFLFGPEGNELSRFAFEVYREMQIVDPKLHFRLGEHTPADLTDQVVGCIQAGCTGIVVVNDAAQVAMLQANCKTLEAAEEYILIGCYEPAVMGRELNCSGACGLNLAKPVEMILATEAPATFEDFMAAYLGMLDAHFTRAADRVRREERLWPRVNPSPLLSGAMTSCFESGRDVSEGGAEYNTSGCCCSGLANAVDSLAVVRQLVYEEQRCTLSELRAALAADWEGYEELRLTAQYRVPKWGNNDDRVDDLAVQITDFLGRRINHEPNARGGVFQAALYGIIGTVGWYGKQTGALPDGRRAGQPLAINTGAALGMDQGGVTALINSVTKVDLAQFPNGTVLDLMLHPSVTSGPEGRQTIAAVIRSDFAQGGMAVQFNIFDANLLREAQRHPEQYAHLQVRLCGWNVRFVDLGPQEQEMFITKAEVA